LVNTHPTNALKILELLLRCGMVCREELNVVLEMIPAVPDRRAAALHGQGNEVAKSREASGQRTQQNTLILQFDPED
jgi:hypothetical protein